MASAWDAKLTNCTGKRFAALHSTVGDDHARRALPCQRDRDGSRRPAGSQNQGRLAAGLVAGLLSKGCHEARCVCVVTFKRSVPVANGVDSADESCLLRHAVQQREHGLLVRHGYVGSEYVRFSKGLHGGCQLRWRYVQSCV